MHGQPGAGGAGAGMMWDDEGFHSRQGPKKGWFILENPSKMDDEMGYPHVRKPPHIYIYKYISIYKSRNGMIN